MADPFRRSPAARGLARALRSKRVATFEALEDLLAGSARLRAVSPESVAAACGEFGVDLGRRFEADRKHLYRRYLIHCLEDRVLSEEESAELEHLGSLLQLTAADRAALHDEVARDVYGKAIRDVLADLRLDPEEAAFLGRLRGELGLTERTAEELYAEGEQRARDRALSEASSRDADFMRHRTPAGRFTGRSTTSIEDAVSDALAKAAVAIPALQWFEVVQIAGYVSDGRPSGWHVTLHAGIPAEE